MNIYFIVTFNFCFFFLFIKKIKITRHIQEALSMMKSCYQGLAYVLHTVLFFWNGLPITLQVI